MASTEQQQARDAFLDAYRGHGRLAVSADLEAEARGLFALAARRAPHETAVVRAFNPDPRADGYECPGSVIETNTPDLPFLVDSVTAEIRANGLDVETVRHPIVAIDRAADGAIVDVGESAGSRLESCMHFALSERLQDERLAELERAIYEVLRNVATVVADLPAMLAAIDRMSEWVAAADDPAGGEDDAEEIEAFLRWVRDGNVILLGFREEAETADGGRAVVPGTALGVLRPVDEGGLGRDVELMTGTGGEDHRLMRVLRSQSLSPVQRREPMETVLVRRVNADGEIDGDGRLLGLLSARALAEPASQTPQLRDKLQRILAGAGLVPGSHDALAAIALFDGFPKAELLAAPVDDLQATIVGLLDVMPGEVRLVGRRARHGRSASLVASVPRDRLTRELRQRWRAILADAYRTSQVELVEVLGEDRRVLVHAFVRSTRVLPEVDLAELERRLSEESRTWAELIEDTLSEHHGLERARDLAERWADRLPASYRARNSPEVAAGDIEALERLLDGDQDLEVDLRGERGPGGGRRTRIALVKKGPKIELSAVTPLLEDHGLRVIEEQPAQLEDHGIDDLWIQAFAVLGPDGQPLDLDAVGTELASSLEAVWRGQTESDPLNRLVLEADLTWRQIRILRAYRSYRQRVGSRFAESFQNDVIVAHPAIVALQIALFEQRFALGGDEPERERRLEQLRTEILDKLDDVELLDHDRILRNQLLLIEATVRTNVYRADHGAMAFKIRSADVPAMPQPAPLFEIFVYSQSMEGIHLRGGRIARGGLRWSDRMDYRTEVYGLMRAQMTKNAVIVPTGAKGGFLLKDRPADPGLLRDAVRAAYVTYIEALLDVTDNLDADRNVVPPEGVRVLDEDDSYLVVAADKGTATFSDTANEIALRRGFWLGDAFASGGSVGYDHKKLGITARGAWESVKRHFRALDVDPETDPITVVGIGDMSGDVFGNGMLLSRSLRLVAAYDHRDVFLDPAPIDGDRCWRERKRLFDEPGSSWQDYDRELLSEGAMIVSRAVKSVRLTPQVKELLGVDDDALDPSALIRAILRAPVDLLWNGGIGTVVKASTETDADAQDRASDAIRVDACDLRCRVVGEGGNLGFTQRGRIEAALGGVLINADFIDNSAGVDSSDHEVNLKILLDRAVARELLTAEERVDLLAEVTDDVVAHVLYDSFQQAQLLAQEIAVAPGRGFAYEDLMETLESAGMLDRAAERLPSTDELAERDRSGEGLTRPELAVLVAYAKRLLTADLLDSTLPEERWTSEALRGYFPAPIVERFADLLDEHPLRRELVATALANEVVDCLGPTFATNMSRELGAPASTVVRCYHAACAVTGAVALWEQIEGLVEVPQSVNVELMAAIDQLVVRVTRWYMLHRPGGSDEASLAYARGAFDALAAEMAAMRPDHWREQDRERAERFIAEGTPERLARVCAALPALYRAPDIVATSATTGRDVLEVARAFFEIGEKLGIARIEDHVLELPTGTRIQRWAQQVVIDDVLDSRRMLAERALQEAPEATPEDAVDLFLERRASARERLAGVTRVLNAEGTPGLAGLTLAIRHLRGLVR